MTWRSRLKAYRLAYQLLRENEVPNWLTPPPDAKYLGPQRENEMPWVITAPLGAQALPMIERIIRERPSEDDGSYSVPVWMVCDSDGAVAFHAGETLLGHLPEQDGARFALAHLSKSQPVCVEGRLRPWEWKDDHAVVYLLAPISDA